MTAHRVAGLAIALLVALPAVAHAGEIRRDGDIVRWTAAPGESNRIVVYASALTVSDGSAPLVAGPGCDGAGVNVATCDMAGVTALVLEAGDGDDWITSASPIPATLSGGAGDDIMEGGAGPDAFDGGADYDVVSYEFHGEAVEAAIDGAQGSGSAKDGAGDTIGVDVEALWGSEGGDRLTGNDAGNDLWGGDGADVLTGGGGVDIVDYSDRATGVVVALDGQPTSGNEQDGPAGTRDTVGADVEGIYGGAGGDVLTGNGAQNLLDGAGGDDRLEARDGVADLVFCGAGNDTAIADAIDELSDCEPVPPINPPIVRPLPLPASAPKDTFAPRVTLRPATRPKLATTLARGLSVQVTCSEACRLSAELRADARTAKRLKLRSRVVGMASATRAGRIVVRFSSDARKRLRKAGKLTLTLQVVATDAAGNRTTRTSSVRLR